MENVDPVLLSYNLSHVTDVTDLSRVSNTLKRLGIMYLGVPKVCAAENWSTR
jgi:hypothetical protein